MISSRPSSSPVSRYLPRRRTSSITGPTASGAALNFADGWLPASVMRRSTSKGSSWRRTVSTSGSSGTT
jgi:hypothetical protein